MHQRTFPPRMRSLWTRHQPSLVPIMALIGGLALGLALHQSAGADAAGRLRHDRPPLVHRTVRPRPPVDLTARAHDHTHAVEDAEDLAEGPHEPADRVPAAPVAGRPQPTLDRRAAGSVSRAFAGLANLQLQLPYGARAIGFHESGTRGAKPLHPMGIPRVNANLPRLPSAPVGDGFEYLVLSSRGRRNAATSAVDIAMPFNNPVHAPVTGTVVDATAYLLYREVPDNALYIVPDSRPDLVVVLMHLNGLKVNVGDRVQAGTTVLALTARLLPFGSQIDRYAGRMPHVHIEVRPR